MVWWDLNEADRIAKDKADKARSQASQQAANDVARERSRRSRAVADAQAAIPVVLERLKAAGYPGVEQVRVAELGRFGRVKRSMKGGWELCRVWSMHYGELSDFPVYLLSDGRLYHYGSTKRPEDVIVPDHDRTRNQDAHVEDLYLISAALTALAAGESPLPSD